MCVRERKREKEVCVCVCVCVCVRKRENMIEDCWISFNRSLFIKIPFNFRLWLYHYHSIYDFIAAVCITRHLKVYENIVVIFVLVIIMNIITSYVKPIT